MNTPAFSSSHSSRDTLPVATAFPFLLHTVQANYANPFHAKALVLVLDAYARDAAGGGQALSEKVRTHLVRELARRSQIFSVLAFAVESPAASSAGSSEIVESSRPVGLVNCIEGFSTFACQPLVNIHDVAVLPEFRGHGIAGKMLALVEALARQRGACKLTLEVLAGNASAQRLYARSGFAPYALDPAWGQAQFLQKMLD